ncbi:MAG: hypothetical protein GVY24_01130 [Planctomycetes bacterium]|jgi:hypothetical protein|nr:hypothetical protein [Planctomycetota bacterium]
MRRSSAKLGWQVGLCGLLVWGVAQAADAAEPLLTEARRAQLSTARDGAALDEGALYALLDAAVDWPAFEPRGATVPDYVALMESPAEHRGDKFLIEGGYVASGVHRLARPGPWGSALHFWVIKFGDIDSEAGDNVAVVLMVDPEGDLETPNPRQPVRVPAVFYKVWRDQERHSGKPTDFLTFVARAGALSQVMVGEPVAAEEGDSALLKSSGPLAIVIVIALGAAWFALRRMLKSMQAAAAKASGARVHYEGDVAEQIELRDDLPEDPVEAMAVLQAEHDAAEAERAKQAKRDPVEALGELETKKDADPSG